MRILLTNDDGIQAKGILALYQQLRKWARVTVVAPDSERSSVGHGITLARPLWIKKIKMPDGSIGYSSSGTPADCVKLAIGKIFKTKPDWVISGINPGANDGHSVFYSGTVAAAREASLIGIPSMAVSVASFTMTDFRTHAALTSRLAKTLRKIPLPPRTFLNINIPACPVSRIKGIRLTHQGTDPIHGKFTKKTDLHRRDYYWMSAKVPVIKKDLSKDTYALNKGYVTITPLLSDLTDYPFLEKLSRVLRRQDKI